MAFNRSEAGLVARMSHLTKSYGAGSTLVTALDDVSLGIAVGQFTAIMGPSGSGKSTLMHIMAGLDSPTSGRAWLGDTEITDLDDGHLTVLRRRRVGFVFQSFNLVPTLDVNGNIYLPFELDGRRPSLAETAWISGLIESLGLGNRLTHRPHRSRGALPARRGQRRLRPVDRHGHPRPDRGELCRSHRVSRGRPSRRRPRALNAGGDLELYARHGAERMRGMTTRDHRSSILVTALSAAFGAGLIQATSYLTQIVAGNQISEHESVQIALLLVAGVFILIAVYVGSIVTANTFATIIAGRTRSIALMRLIGSSASSLRRAVAREGLLVGVVGAAIGAVVGLSLTVAGIRIAVAAGSVPALDYGSVNPLIVLPTVIVVLSTW